MDSQQTNSLALGLGAVAAGIAASYLLTRPATKDAPASSNDPTSPGNSPLPRPSTMTKSQSSTTQVKRL